MGYGVGPGANDRVMAFTTAYNAITKGEEEGRKRARERGEGCCSRRQLPHINLMHPSAVRSVVGPYGFPFRGETSTFSLLPFLPSLLVLSVVCRFLRWRKRRRRRRRRINCAPCSCF